MKSALTAFTVFAMAITEPAWAAGGFKPVKAEIVEVPEERRDWVVPIGNVRITFTNGHSEMWTRNGRCLLPKVSPSGLVGWTRFTERASRGEPVNASLRIFRTENEFREFQAGPFIEEWDFTDGDAVLVIKSRGRHGPANYLRYDVATGEVLGSATGVTPYAQLPEWAKAYADDRP